MKEGLEGGEKFQVMEQVLDSKTGLTKFVNKGKITVDKNYLWDNRYNAADSHEVQKDKDGNEMKFTKFKGGKNYYSGMLIKQIK